MFRPDSIHFLSERRRRRRSTAMHSQSAHADRLTPPLIEEETQLPSGNWGVGIHRQEDHIILL
jgi:hypothetical protein